VKKKDQYQVVLDRTPFYAESGGQAGDSGWLSFGEERVKVIDTQKENDLIIHIVNKLPADLSAVVHASVDADKRHATENNHTAVHLMHAALHEVLGKNALQKGQSVDPERLRFDFSHFQKVGKEELEQIEQIVNEKIRANIVLEEERAMPIAEARASGAMMLFGEKYGDFVRMVTFDKDFSRELCGGTHVDATGKIGLFKILTETGVAAGIRRIEAITANKAEAFVKAELEELGQIRQAFKNAPNPAEQVAALQEENKALKKQVEQLMAKQALSLKSDLLQRVEAHPGFQLLTARLPLHDSNAIKNLAFQIEKEVENVVIIFGAEVKEKPQLLVMINKELAAAKRFHAGTIVREAAKAMKGGGGGQPFFATAGGKDIGGLDAAIDLAKAAIIG
ncbi:MAG: DHHA1 domain-containing protein, partial [Bacteroidota bacterium]